MALISLPAHKRLLAAFGWIAALAVLLFAYIPVLQTIPNGSENYFMIDVGETQTVLNKWGTLHATGYPVFVMIGSTLVALMRAFGIGAAEAPALVSLFWGVLALTAIYLLALKITGRPLASAVMVILFGLTRTMWIHNDIAEVYTMTLFLLVLMLLVALWTPPISGRVYWLALLGGIGVAHHRALAMAAPALIFAVWAELVALIRQRPSRLLVLIGLGLLGLIPYAYLYLRARAGAAWVYGEPGTLQGLIDQFMGKEADHFIGLPGSLDALIANINLVNTVLITDVTIPGALLGIVGLIVGLSRHRRAALVLILSAAAAYGFHAFFYSDILSALILPVTLSFAFGWLFLAEALLSLKKLRLHAPVDLPLRPISAALLAGIALVFGLFQYQQNQPFIHGLTSDTTGLETIAMAQHTPPGSTLMLAWGPRYFAVGFARDVLGLLPGVRLVDHKADYRSLIQQGPLVTAAYTFYNQPIRWWEDQLGSPVYLHAVAPELVEIDTQPELSTTPDDAPGVIETGHRIDCLPDKLILHVAWHTDTPPQQDYSVFVHLLDDAGSLIAQDDHSAPVYGWRPLTSWVANEVVRDVYTLPRRSDAATINYGLYRQLANGSFDDVVSYTLPVECR